ncbi:type I DNA topoisomerase [Chlorobium phaeovibrioides]|uniref:DNA topoisomerase 1 n=1 Tax=Chlorobium phaeovibrioides TaxID=1094 RepID=A0A3S0NB73_CHLPH|nr:type I DNA topoisomerase [Chlorobium phaeovibrioides]MWV54241.1 type I DNA topoisomerase [Chlorobium phaeovibrioides]RTY39423.1 type I DNA topoisomerase [Chlorobium phaeovibrioides]
MAVKTPSLSAKNRTLIVVESPSKAKTINKYLGDGYAVFASVGHIKDLPKKEIGLDFDNHYEPSYEVIAGKDKVVRQLKKLSAEASAVMIATDPDREGEAIAWHIANEIGKTSKPVTRVMFNEITKSAILEAIADPRQIDYKLVRSQQTRQGLDKIVGYRISPFLWNVVMRGLSAGRVQSVALRLICEREMEINRFEIQEYWTIAADFITSEKESFKARLMSINGEKPDLKNQASAEAAAALVSKGNYRLKAIAPRTQQRRAPLPFTTSLLQQAASNQLGFGSKKTMRAAQQLYEGIDLGSEGATGLITYMRTDSIRIGDEAKGQARHFIENAFGKEYIGFGGAAAKSSKNAQDAHEAIRPTSVNRCPEDLKPYLSTDQYRLYDLIWKRFVAAMMAPAKIEQTRVDIADPEARISFRANGSRVLFPGFMKVFNDQEELAYEERKSTKDEGEKEQTVRLPKVLRENDPLNLGPIDSRQSFTRPPARFSEATLVKDLDNYGIGRPSTYASIFSTLQDRRYVELQKKKIIPTVLGMDVSEILVSNFPELFNVDFTAGMENELDKVAVGEDDYESVLDRFYKPLEATLSARKEDPVIPQNRDAAPCEKCGEGRMIVKWTQSGKFLGCSRYPKCRNNIPIATNKEKPKDTGILCPSCNEGHMLLRNGRHGAFLACSSYPKCKGLLNLGKQRQIEPMKLPPVLTDLTCPKCGAPMNLRIGKRGPWLGCSKFPKCRGRMAWNSLEEPVRLHWEEVMAEHIKANPAITITMIDGSPASMTMPIDDIITSAEERGLVRVEAEEQAAEKTPATE